MSESNAVPVISHAPMKFLMTVAHDRRTYLFKPPDYGKPAEPVMVDKAFLDAWAAANADADILDLLQWPGKPATRRAGAHERGAS